MKKITFTNFLIIIFLSCSISKTNCVENELSIEVKEIVEFSDLGPNVKGELIEPFKVFLQPVILDFGPIDVLDRKYVDFLKSIVVANEKFKGILDFRVASEIYYVAENDVTMEDLRVMPLKSRIKWSEGYQEEGMVTVFIVPGKEGLNGFVNRYSVPEWNCVDHETILSYVYIFEEAISNHKTLTHELGHFFGLDHCLCCSEEKDEECWFNVMNQVYSPCRTDFTDDQLTVIWNYLPFVDCFLH